MLPALRTLRCLGARPGARWLRTAERGSLDDGKPGKTILAVLYSGGDLAEKQPRLLGCVEAGLGLRPWLEGQGHRLICTPSKEGASSELERHLPEADVGAGASPAWGARLHRLHGTDLRGCAACLQVLITTPFWPAYIDADRIKRAPKLKLALTAGVGSDHIDLLAAAEAGVTVAEVTGRGGLEGVGIHAAESQQFHCFVRFPGFAGCNVVSVAEHVFMQTLALVGQAAEKSLRAHCLGSSLLLSLPPTPPCQVRNFMEGQRQVVAGEWDIARIAASAYDLEGKTLGTLGCGRIRQCVLQRFRGFDPGALLYHDYARLAPEREASLGAEFVGSVAELAERCDVLTINCE